MPHSAQSQHTNYWALRTRKRHQQEHRPQRPTKSSDPTQHAKGRTGGCPGPRKGATTRRNVTQGGSNINRSVQLAKILVLCLLLVLVFVTTNSVYHCVRVFVILLYNPTHSPMAHALPPPPPSFLDSEIQQRSLSVNMVAFYFKITHFYLSLIHILGHGVWLCALWDAVSKPRLSRRLTMICVWSVGESGRECGTNLGSLIYCAQECIRTHSKARFQSVQSTRVLVLCFLWVNNAKG